MKKSILMFVAIVMMAITTTVSAQNWGSATATQLVDATLVLPLSLSKVQDLNFGTMLVPSTDATVIINPQTGIVTASAGLHHVEIGNQYGEFRATGEPGKSYTLSLPNQIYLVNVNDPSKKMFVTDFKTFYVNTGSATTGNLIAAGGTESIRIGATLNINANQMNGAYTGSFIATAAYQ